MKEFPGGPVVGTWHFTAPGSTPGWEAKIAQAMQSSQKKKEREREEDCWHPSSSQVEAKSGNKFYAFVFKIQNKVIFKASFSGRRLWWIRERVNCFKI